MPSNDRLDHAVINVKHDMDGAVRLFKKLGFSLTPRGFHSHGSINHLMIFGSDYLELIGIPENKTIERQDLMKAPIGINGLVLKADDINEIYTRIVAAGFDGDPPKGFYRPIKIQGEQKDAKFQTVTVRDDVFPGGRVYYCQHDTPELVWRPEWQKHPNGVTSVTEFVTVAQAPKREAERFAALLNTGVNIHDNGAFCLNLESCHLTVLDPKQYAFRYEDLASSLEDRESIFGAVVFATDSLPALNEILEDTDDITTIRHPGRTIVRVTAYNTVLEFIDVELVKTTITDK